MDGILRTKLVFIPATIPVFYVYKLQLKKTKLKKTKHLMQNELFRYVCTPRLISLFNSFYLFI